VITTDLQLALRPPAWVRVLVVLFAAAVPCYVRFGVDPVRGDGSWIVAAGAFLITAVLAWRLARLAVLGTADGRLVVRNYRRDRTVHRGDVDRVVIDVARTGWSVQLELIDGSVAPLDATSTPLRPMFGARLERQADAVRDWFGTTRPSRTAERRAATTVASDRGTRSRLNFSSFLLVSRVLITYDRTHVR
jgi:hypothetical protein